MGQTCCAAWGVGRCRPPPVVESYTEGTVARLEQGGGYVVTRPFQVQIAGDRMIIPVGEWSDGASGPAPDVGLSWIVHDHVYTHRPPHVTRDQADRAMIEIARDIEGNGWFARYVACGFVFAPRFFDRAWLR